MRTFAKELIDIQPDLALADTTPASKEVKIGEAGDIWIARPHYGHWIGGNDIVAFFESLLTAFANWRKTLSEWGPMALSLGQPGASGVGPAGCRTTNASPDRRRLVMSE